MRHAITVLTTLATLACGGERSASRSDSADAAPADSLGGAPQLVVGARYFTQSGTVVCPTRDALERLLAAARTGDSVAFSTLLAGGGCAPAADRSVVYVEEQVQALARVRGAGGTATYWTTAERLSPR